MTYASFLLLSIGLIIIYAPVMFFYQSKGLSKQNTWTCYSVATIGVFMCIVSVFFFREITFSISDITLYILALAASLKMVVSIRFPWEKSTEKTKQRLIENLESMKGRVPEDERQNLLRQVESI